MHTVYKICRKMNDGSYGSYFQDVLNVSYELDKTTVPEYGYLFACRSVNDALESTGISGMYDTEHVILEGETSYIFYPKQVSCGLALDVFLTREITREIIQHFWKDVFSGATHEYLILNYSVFHVDKMTVFIPDFTPTKVYTFDKKSKKWVF